MSRILRNAIECRYCGVVLESTHVHDYRVHTCRKGPIVGKVLKWVDDATAPGGCRLTETSEDAYPWLMVDGGKEYIRRSGNPEHFIDRSEYNDEDRT